MDSRPIILVVEDEPLIGLSVQDGLDEAGYDVRLMNTSMKALNELESAFEALSGLVTDIRLGDDKDGWQVARRARELSPLIPVVYMSGDSAIDHASKGVPDSIMVQKPFASAQIVTAMATLMNQQRPTQSTD